ncbi:hypothetical protein BDW02DRAFT_292093 [Decorospora gaudefroyi]|uniref:Uncharacterized protein n=1 Tax=Decorospora gaudefroyi TaxID=184978 RepID=A0A6A5KIH1_9PLEO|nr:hypothetical protein BDW02DRAFT_292093 [Decorospora gaudefroyi]
MHSWRSFSSSVLYVLRGGLVGSVCIGFFGARWWDSCIGRVRFHYFEYLHLALMCVYVLCVCTVSVLWLFVPVSYHTTHPINQVLNLCRLLLCSCSQGTRRQSCLIGGGSGILPLGLFRIVILGRPLYVSVDGIFMVHY